MGNQMSDVFARVVSIFHGHDIVETDGSSHHDVQIETISTLSANTDRHEEEEEEEEEEEANMEMAAITVVAAPPTGADQEISDNDGGREGDDVHIVGIRNNIQTNGSAGGGGGTVQLEGNYEGQQPVQRKMNSGIFLSISTATLSVASAAISRPTPKRLYSEGHLLIVAYSLDLIMLLVLGILLIGLTFGLTLVPDNWVPAVRTAMTTVTGALLVLLLFLVAFVTYNLVPQYHP